VSVTSRREHHKKIYSSVLTNVPTARRGTACYFCVGYVLDETHQIQDKPTACCCSFVRTVCDPAPLTVGLMKATTGTGRLQRQWEGAKCVS
jgi:hypothetical protein